MFTVPRCLVWALASLAAAARNAVSPNTYCAGAKHQRVTSGKPTFSVPAEIVDVGTRLFGARELESLIRGTKAMTFSWALGNTTIYSLRGDHTEFCSAVLSYNFRSDIAAGSTVVDVGANIGDTSIQIHQLNPRARIVALEPVPTSYFYLRWNLLANHVPVLSESDFTGDSGLLEGGVLPLHAGATADGRNIAMVYGQRYSKNARVQNGPTSQVSANVTSYELPKLLKALGAREKAIPLLKVDCEGCEFEVLPQMQRAGALDFVERIVGEIHAPPTHGGPCSKISKLMHLGGVRSNLPIFSILREP